MPGDRTEKTNLTIHPKQLIADTYEKRYGWKDAEVSNGVAAFNGELYIVRQKPGIGDGEICYFAKGKVRMFGSTEDLVDFLASNESRPLLERVCSRSVITSVVFVFLVVGIFLAGFWHEQFGTQAFNILGSVLGVAAGFFFGQSFAKEHSGS